jgi:hypothetical protein
MAGVDRTPAILFGHWMGDTVTVRIWTGIPDADNRT